MPSISVLFKESEKVINRLRHAHVIVNYDQIREGAFVGHRLTQTGVTMYIFPYIIVISILSGEIKKIMMEYTAGSNFFVREVKTGNYLWV